MFKLVAYTCSFVKPCKNDYIKLDGKGWKFGGEERVGEEIWRHENNLRE